MPQIASFRGIRYSEEAGGIDSLVSPPFDAIDENARSELAARSEHNVVHLTLPEGDGEAKYGLAGDVFRRWRDEGLLVTDDEQAVYVLTQAFRLADGREVVRSGVLCPTRLHAPEDGMVMAHERTATIPVEDRLDLMSAVGASLEPVFFLFRDEAAIVRSVMASATSDTPVCELRTDDGVTQRLYRLTEPDALSALGAALRPHPAIIADGHHRYMASLAYRAKKGAAPGPHQYVLGFLCPMEDEGLVLRPTHRLLHSTPEFEIDGFLEETARWFDVSAMGVDLRGPDGRLSLRRSLEEAGRSTAAFALVLPDGRAYLLALRPGAEPPGLPDEPALRALDVTVLHSVLFQEVLGLTEESLESLDHLQYIESTTEALLRVLGAESSEEEQALFMVNPTPIEHVEAVTQAGVKMPQKSTRFFPKIPSGLVFSSLDDGPVFGL